MVHCFPASELFLSWSHSFFLHVHIFSEVNSELQIPHEILSILARYSTVNPFTALFLVETTEVSVEGLG